MSVRNYGETIWHTGVGHHKIGMEWIAVIIVFDNRFLAYRGQNFLRKNYAKFPSLPTITPVDNEFSTSREWF